MVDKVPFHSHLREIINSTVHEVYDATLKFPREEIYGVTSQLRRAIISVMLNYIEGYARKKSKVMRNFYETSYGSLKEAEYLVVFSHEREYLDKHTYGSIMKKIDEAGKMLWSTIIKIDSFDT